ncbi:O-antigen ligase family protein [Fulvivirgaceae bacterium BMA10]|uniref:O-antigen ligase family protein n=1 Tax=Splendidivirga corallicola TaxID=3051826 RepID=A0ABT8KX52_9BACT|nr:O-antigen ligase family protein [Fulvivirgaceae bacterium BMA10]
MFEKQAHNIFFFIAHAVLAYLSVQSSTVGLVWGTAILGIGVIHIIRSGNENNEAAYYAAYWMGLEIVLRMNGGSLSYESGKYGIIIFLLCGLIFEHRAFRLPRKFLLFFLLLLPATTVVEFESFGEARKDMLFNISGPLSLIFSALYFYRRTFTKEQVNKILYFILLPVFSLGIVLFFKTPEIAEIEFTLNSSAKLSGGFGANQVSTILGLGIFIMGFAIFLKFQITGYRLLDIALFAYFSFRGLLTFSRGGVVTAIVALALSLIVYAIVSNDGRLVRQIIVTSFFIGIAGFFAWDYTNNVTGGFLQKRYANESSNPFKKRDITTGRLTIILSELKAFQEYPVLGAGLGMGKKYREERNIHFRASHTEFSRLLAEHGLYGLMALLILLFSPVAHYFWSNEQSKPYVVAFAVLGLMTMLHAAMRLSMPGFMYGLIFISVIPSKDDSVHREQT